MFVSENIAALNPVGLSRTFLIGKKFPIIQWEFVCSVNNGEATGFCCGVRTMEVLKTIALHSSSGGV